MERTAESHSSSGMEIQTVTRILSEMVRQTFIAYVVTITMKASWRVYLICLQSGSHVDDYDNLTLAKPQWMQRKRGPMVEALSNYDLVPQNNIFLHRRSALLISDHATTFQILISLIELWQTVKLRFWLSHTWAINNQNQHMSNKQLMWLLRK